MCTVTWRLELTEGSAEDPARRARLELFFNRDEARTRGPAGPPRVVRGERGVRVLAPIDGDAGGTWIAANEHGLALGLLNLYQAAAPRVSRPTSRGLLTLGIASDAAHLADVRDRIDRTDLERFAGFRLLAFDASGELGLFAWDGVQARWVEPDELAPPILSSGYDLAGVDRARRLTWQAHLERFGGPTDAALASFHASQEPEPGPFAVRMSRADARTVSTTRLSVDSSGARMAYVAVPERSFEPDPPPAVAELRFEAASRP